MYGKIVKMYCWFLFVLVILFTACLFAGCRTTMVPDITERTKEYREIESEIRDGETELAVTGAKLETGLSGLEQSIRDSETNEQELGEIIQSVRNRELTENKLIELGII